MLIPNVARLGCDLLTPTTFCYDLTFTIGCVAPTSLDEPPITNGDIPPDDITDDLTGAGPDTIGDCTIGDCTIGDGDDTIGDDIIGDCTTLFLLIIEVACTLLFIIGI